METVQDEMNIAPIDMKLCQELDFDAVEIKQIEKGYWVVKVRGSKPHAHMKVELVPSSHQSQPEYWDINVHGCVNEDIQHPKMTPFEVTLPLAAYRGVRGIEIVGASKSKRYDIPKQSF